MATNGEHAPVRGASVAKERRRARVARTAAAAGAAALLLAGCTVDLGTLPGTTSSGAVDISDDGLVVGSASGGGIGIRAFLRRPNGTMVDLGPAPGENLTLVQATAVNDDEVVVGTAAWGGGFNPMQAFRWTATDGMRLLPSSFYSTANDINEPGDVVGQQVFAGTGKYDRTYRAARWDGVTGAAEILPPLPGGEGYCEATAVNDHGDVVGQCDSKAVLWPASDRTPVGLGAGRPEDINDDRMIVGTAGGVAVVWEPDAIEARPLRGTGTKRATGVNDDGIIVGVATLGGAGDRAVKWATMDGEPTDLGGLGGAAASAAAINGRGAVVGTATKADGTQRAVRWDPESPPATVPTTAAPEG